MFRGPMLATARVVVRQATLGIANPMSSLLPVAVAHSGVAALLLVALVVLNFSLSLKLSR